MKKHPIDELFGSNLREHSTTPSTRAAELFQQRLAEKKKPKGILFMAPTKRYYWAAAASVLFVLTLGWFAVQDEQIGETVAEKSNQTKTVEKTVTLPESKTNVAIAVQKDESVVRSATQIAKVNQRKSAQKTIAPIETKTTSVTTQGEEQTKTSPIFAMPILDEPIMDKLTVAVLDAEKNKKKEEVKQRKLQNENSVLFKNSVAETVIVISKIQPKEEQLYIPEISGDSRVTIAQATQMGQKRQEADRSFIAKVVTEIKHLKHGEKLDVAGLNKTSDAVFARSEGGFIANEKEELNYRLGRLKNMLSKNELR